MVIPREPLPPSRYVLQCTTARGYTVIPGEPFARAGPPRPPTDPSPPPRGCWGRPAPQLTEEPAAAGGGRRSAAGTNRCGVTMATASSPSPSHPPPPTTCQRQQRQERAHNGAALLPHPGRVRGALAAASYRARGARPAPPLVGVIESAPPPRRAPPPPTASPLVGMRGRCQVCEGRVPQGTWEDPSSCSKS